MAGEWWRGAVIYQIYPRSFFDSNGDGVGDLAGIVDRLDYVAGLGVDAIWVSPFFASPMADFGYDVSDYRAVDPIFGTLDDFDRLVARAHVLGLKVLIDQVWSHTSDQHAWFRDSRRAGDALHADWYVWADPSPDGTPPNNWLSVFGGPAWTWDAQRRQYYLHHFLSCQPQLNLRNPATMEAVLASGAFWLDRGVDGFRLDAVDFLTHDAKLRSNPPQPPPGGVFPAKLFGLQSHIHDMTQPDVLDVFHAIRRLLDGYPDRTTLGELSSQAGAAGRIARYTAGTDYLHMAYSLGFMRAEFGRDIVLQWLADAAAADPSSWTAWSFSNHDVPRVASRWGNSPDGTPDRDLVRMLMGLLLSLRGSICVYQGEELGLTESVIGFGDLHDPFGIAHYPDYVGRDGCRTPMPWQIDAAQAGFTTGKPWLPVDTAHRQLSVDVQERDPSSTLHQWRRFLAWRKTHPALIGGDLELVAAPAPLVAFRRIGEGERLLVVINFGDDIADLPARLIAGTHPTSGHGFALVERAGSVALPRYGMLFATEH